MGKFSTNESSTKRTEKTVATVKTYGMAPAFEPIEEVPHGEVSAFADSPKIKVTSKAISFDSEQAPILAQFWLNLPLQDGLITVNAIYQQIKKVVIDYHLKHNDAFYSQYPKLLVLSKQERANPSAYGIDDNEKLRINHHKYDRRLAHKIWHYMNASAMLIGAAANMCLLTQLKSSTKFGDFSEAFKVGRINNILSRYQAFFKPVHLEDYVIKYSRYATGTTSYGASIAAFPLWITDVKGNRGFSSVNITDAFDGVQASGRDVNLLVDHAEDLYDYIELMRNMDIVRAEFIRDDVCTDSNSKYHHANYIADQLQAKSDRLRGWVTGDPSPSSQPFAENPDHFRDIVPSMSKIANSSTITVAGSGMDTTTVKLDSDGSMVYHSNTSVKVGDSTYSTDDNIINRVWDAINFWLDYNEKYFVEFSQPTSEVVKFCQEMGWIDTKTTSSASLFMQIKNQALSKPFDMSSLRDEMIYKRDNDVTTATQIKWMPIVDRYDDTWDDAAVDFERNFNRYKVDIDDPVFVALEARKYPGISPTIFHSLGSTAMEHRSDEPHVANAITSGSLQMDNTNSTDVYPVHGILGKYASYLDFASSSHIDAEHTTIEVVAENPGDAKDYIAMANGIVIKETMDYPRAFYQPLIDRTDPFQCGFNVVFDSKSLTETEFDRFFLDPTRFMTQAGDADPVGIYEPVNSGIPTMPTYKSTSAGYFQAAIESSNWLYKIKHPLLFVGDQIWYLPESSYGTLGCGNYAEAFRAGQRNPSTFNYGDTMLKLEQQAGTIKSAVQANPGDYFHFDARSVSVTTTDAVYLILAAGLTGAINPSRQYSVPGDSNSPVSTDLALSLLSTAKLSTGALTTCLFDPHYGGINLVKYDSPDFNLLAAMALVGLTYADKSTRDPNFMIATKRSGDTAHVTFSLGDNKLQMAFDSYDSIAQFLVWSIDNLRFKKVMRNGRRLYVPDEFVEFSGFSGPAKTALALLSRAQIMYSGADDTWYLNSIPSDKQETMKEIKLNEGSAIDFGGLINSPEVAARLLPRRTIGMRVKQVRRIKAAQVSANTYAAGTKQAQDQADSSSATDKGSWDKFKNKSSAKSNPKGKGKREFDGVDKKAESIRDEADKLDKMATSIETNSAQNASDSTS